MAGTESDPRPATMDIVMTILEAATWGVIAGLVAGAAWMLMFGLA